MSYSKGDVILLSYPFTDLKTTKVRPAVVVSSEDSRYSDVFVAPITSRTDNLNIGEFTMADWNAAGLNVASAVKRGYREISSLQGNGCNLAITKGHGEAQHPRALLSLSTALSGQRF